MEKLGMADCFSPDRVVQSGGVADLDPHYFFGKPFPHQNAKPGAVEAQ
jgi:hypothetical protein